MKRFSLLFILVFAVAAFGQEAMEAPAEEVVTEMVVDSAAVDTMAMDEMLMDDTETVVDEAVVEEDAGDALEAMLAEEGTDAMPLETTNIAAPSVGLLLGYPVYTTSGLSNYDPTPVFGVVFNSPVGFELGPIGASVGAEVSLYEFESKASGVTALATLNLALLQTPAGAVSVEVGAGWVGIGVGGTGGLSFAYVIPNMPITVTPYAKAYLTLGDDDTGSLAWVNAGLNLSYDLSDLF